MANHPSAEKRNRQRARRTDRNRATKSTVRTLVKRARTAIEAGDQAAASAVVTAVSAVDRAASKGIVHPKAAARRKARLARALHKAKTAAAKLGSRPRFPRRSQRAVDRTEVVPRTRSLVLRGERVRMG